MNKNIKILVADDEPIGRQLLEAILMPEGYKIVFGCDGQEAYDTALKEIPDIILLDVMMPHMDGFEVCKKLRSEKSTAHIPVYLITALDDRDSRIRGIEAGADDYISKPFDRVEILGKIKNRMNVLKSFTDKDTNTAGPKSAATSSPAQSELLKGFLETFLESGRTLETAIVLNDIEPTKSNHAFFSVNSVDCTFILMVSNQLDGTDAALANSIFGYLWMQAIKPAGLAALKIVQQTILSLNDFINKKNLPMLSKAGFSFSILMNPKESNELVLAGLNQAVLSEQHSDMLNPDSEKKYQFFYLQGNQELRFTTPTKTILLSPNLTSELPQQLLLNTFNEELKEVEDKELFNQVKLKFNQVSDYLLVLLNLH